MRIYSFLRERENERVPSASLQTAKILCLVFAGVGATSKPRQAYAIR